MLCLVILSVLIFIEALPNNVLSMEDWLKYYLL